MDLTGCSAQLDLILDGIKQVASGLCQQDYPAWVVLRFGSIYDLNTYGDNGKLTVLESCKQESCRSD